MIKNANIGHVARVLCPLLSVMMVVLISSGCASKLTGNHDLALRGGGDEYGSSLYSKEIAQAVVNWGESESYSRNHPGLLFPSHAMESLLDGYGGDISFMYDYGIYGRHDYLLGVHDGSDDKVIYSDALITDDETTYESNGRSYVYGRRRVRTTQLRRGR